MSPELEMKQRSAPLSPASRRSGTKSFWERKLEEEEGVEMEREKILRMPKATARQVTFWKQRRELLKKAAELTILCDAHVGVIIFSPAGKVFEYSTPSMNETIKRYKMHSRGIQKLEQPSVELKLPNRNYASLLKEVSDATQKLREMRGEDIQGLSVQELQQLEKTLETGLSRVLERKDQKIAGDLNGLQQKGLSLMKENAKLRQQIMDQMKRGNGPVFAAESETISEDGQSSDSINNSSKVAGDYGHREDSSGISL